MIKRLKNQELLSQKPNIKLCPNHYHFISDAGRIWKSEYWGTAYSNGKGWYTQTVKGVK